MEQVNSMSTNDLIFALAVLVLMGFLAWLIFGRDN